MEQQQPRRRMTQGEVALSGLKLMTAMLEEQIALQTQEDSSRAMAARLAAMTIQELHQSFNELRIAADITRLAMDCLAIAIAELDPQMKQIVSLFDQMLQTTPPGGAQ